MLTFLHQYGTAATWWDCSLPELPANIFLLQKKVNTSYRLNSVLPRGPSLSTALKTLCSRLIWRVEITVKFRCSCLDWYVFSWTEYHIPTDTSSVHCLKCQVCVEQWVCDGWSYMVRGHSFPLRSQCLCHVLTTEQGCWQGSRARLSIRLCWESWITQSPQTVLLPIGNVSTGGGAASRAVLASFQFLVLF